MTIDLFADIACPWCYIGEAHLAAALAARRHLGVERRWRPFQLQPDLPPEGAPRDPFFERKFGGPERMAAAFDHVRRAGAAAGLRFDFDRLAGAPNTTDAHRLVLLAGAYGRTWEAADALFEGYFAEGRDLNDAQDLVAIAEQAGLPGADVRALLGDGRYRETVAESQAAAARLGVTGVPLAVFDGRYAVSGAQPVQAFLDVIDRLTRDGEAALDAA